VLIANKGYMLLDGSHTWSLNSLLTGADSSPYDFELLGRFGEFTKRGKGRIPRERRAWGRERGGEITRGKDRELKEEERKRMRE
jgi:hypothetical protein